jgi:hypothetical protein
MGVGFAEKMPIFKLGDGVNLNLIVGDVVGCPEGCPVGMTGQLSSILSACWE